MAEYDYAEEKKRLNMGKAFLKSEKEADRYDLQKSIDEKRLAEELKVSPKERKAKPENYSKEATENLDLFKKGGAVKSSASRRADGCATKGKTKGRMI
jgi:hypothetical protein